MAPTLIPPRQLTPAEQFKIDQAVRDREGSATEMHEAITSEESRRVYIPKAAADLDAQQRALDAKRGELEALRLEQIAVVKRWTDLLRGRDEIKEMFTALDTKEKHYTELLAACEQQTIDALAVNDLSSIGTCQGAALTIIASERILKIAKATRKMMDADFARVLAEIEAYSELHGIEEQSAPPVEAAPEA